MRDICGLLWVEKFDVTGAWLVSARAMTACRKPVPLKRAVSVASRHSWLPRGVFSSKSSASIYTMPSEPESSWTVQAL